LEAEGMKSSLEKLKEWCADDEGMMQDLNRISKLFHFKWEYKSVILDKKDMETVILMRDYIIRHRDFKFLEESAEHSDFSG
jgi:hypothetical protein